MAQVTGYKPGEFVHSFGDVHIYENHLEQAKEQLRRKPKKFPTVKIDKSIKNVDKFRPEHAILENYNPYPPIKAELTVSGGYFDKSLKTKKHAKKNPKISMIVAVDEKLGIGKNNRMPWNIPEDKNWFKEKTMGHTVIMGKNTFDSIVGYLGKPLPGRTNIVVTSQIPSNQKKEAYFAKTLRGALTLAKKLEKNGEVFFIGGARLYASAINLVERLYVTEVTGKYNCDTFFPNYSDFSKEVYSKSGKSDRYRFKFRILEK